MTDNTLIDVLVLVTPDGNFGAVRIDGSANECLEAMTKAWRASISVEEREHIGDAGPTAVIQKMTPDGYQRIGCTNAHWINAINDERASR